MKKLFVPALAGLLFHVGGAYALESTSAHASFDWESMTIQLLDLDLTDGESPSVVWSNRYGDVSANSASYEVGHSSTIGNSYHASSPTSVISATADTFAANGSSSFDNMDLLLEAYAEQSADPVNRYTQNSGTTSGSTHASFKLSGAGVLIITVPYSLDVTGLKSVDYYTKGRAGVNLSATYSASDGSYSGSDYASKYFDSYYNGDQSFSGLFVMSLANPGGSVTTSGVLNTSLYANAYAAANPGVVPGVPEPETYAMMLVGLALIGGVTRYRKA